jgi:hypothetical protein
VKDKHCPLGGNRKGGKLLKEKREIENFIKWEMLLSIINTESAPKCKLTGLLQRHKDARGYNER